MGKNKKSELPQLRRQINSIDSEIIKLLSNRRKLSKEVIIEKEKGHNPIRDQKREADLLDKLLKVGRKEGLDAHFVSKVFYEIIEDSVRFQQSFVQKSLNEKTKQKNLIIAMQGIEGSYSYLAAKKFFSLSDVKLSFNSKKRFDEVVQAVEKGEADYAILPIENTTSGGINEVYDLFLHTTLSIIGETKFQVKHCLVANNEMPIEKIKKIYAHYQAVSQCSKFLETIPNASIEYFADTAMSAQKIAEEGNSNNAAIASVEAAKLFKLKILKNDIANQIENYTRFLVASRKPMAVDTRIPCKTSLVLATSHTPGSLVDALNVFRKYSVNLTKLESRPIIGNPWEEMFYLDFEGNIADEIIQKVLDELGQHTRFLKVLGSYPIETLYKTKIEFLVPEKESKSTSKKVSAEAEKPKPVVSIKKSKSYKLASREYKSDDTIIKVKDVQIGGNNFIVIAGPCSVENEEMIMQCALEAKENGAQILRGGCFKPRTSPYSFQGLGYEGVKILANTGKYYDMPVITEAMDTDQVAEIAKSSDIIQIGARNMQNFALLKEVGKTHRPVMLKRGLSASIDEWLNAAEYILAQGNRQVMLCERGIRTFETATRNTLDISAIPVLKELTHLPVIVDPSHAIGERNKVIPLAKAAKVVGAHGIMIEFHPDPPKALSDPEQALYFTQFEQMMRELKQL